MVLFLYLKEISSKDSSYLFEIIYYHDFLRKIKKPTNTAYFNIPNKIPPRHKNKIRNSKVILEVLIIQTMGLVLTGKSSYEIF